jgi:hypothetical protein
MGVNMAKIIESVRVTLSLQVNTGGEWGTIRERRAHPDEVEAELAYMVQQHDRWIGCRFFGDAPLRIMLAYPDGSRKKVM